MSWDTAVALIGKRAAGVCYTGNTRTASGAALARNASLIVSAGRRICGLSCGR